MYLVGGAHPHKTEAQLIIERLVASRERLVCDAEVYQEILHRYVSIERREAIRPAFVVFADLVDDVFRLKCGTPWARQRLCGGRKAKRPSYCLRAAASSSSFSLGKRSNVRSIVLPSRCLSKKSIMAVQSSAVKAWPCLA
jgi:hypothetical protein